MTPAAMSDLRYPIGPFVLPSTFGEADRLEAIRRIAATPGALARAVDGLDARQLDTPYRPGGWTVRQLVHHVPDSHLNAYCRFRLTLTEEKPTIRTYEEKRWAELPDARSAPIPMSLALLESLHLRWGALLEALALEDLRRPLQHPEMGALRLADLLAMYAWHGDHHTAHVTRLREREGW